MFDTPAITWTLTATLLLSGTYHFLQAIRSHHITDRINKTLHALMHILMAAMLWNLLPSTALAQIAVLAGAASWFGIQAVARPEFKLLCTNNQGRLKCVYHSLTMAGAALMIAMMGHVTATGPGTIQAGAKSMAGMPMAHDHSAMAVASPTMPAPMVHHSPNLAILLTVFFAGAAVIFIILLLRFLAAKANCTASSRLSMRTDHTLEALSAAIMALMFTTMAT